jgi:hypothetical protein
MRLCEYVRVCVYACAFVFIHKYSYICTVVQEEMMTLARPTFIHTYMHTYMCRVVQEEMMTLARSTFIYTYMHTYIHMQGGARRDDDTSKASKKSVAAQVCSLPYVCVCVCSCWLSVHTQ